MSHPSLASLVLATGLLGLFVSACQPDAGPGVASTVLRETTAAEFSGEIDTTLSDSEPAYLSRVSAAAGAPNIVIVLADDLGYADIEPYGGDIHTPNLSALANSGLRYSHFTVTGVCSPTRAALLTGLNHHAAGVGWLAEWDAGYPGYRGELGADTATLPEILRERGYATLMAGKWHLTHSNKRSQLGPFDSWPTHRGFDRFWGFLDGEASQWQPHALIDGTTQLPPETDPDFYFPDALTDQAIKMVRDLRALSPGKPFFLYYTPGAPHAPHHTRARDRARYQGSYDAGYDVIREQRLAKQKTLGLLPAGTSLSPRNPGVAPWRNLTDDERHLYTALQENYAAFVDNLDQNIGRLREYLANIGELDNTIFIFLSDNGASREVGVHGSTNVMAFYHNRPLTVQESLSNIDHLGDTESHPHYPHGWMQASNTPFAHAKRTNWAGGVRVPFIISWPAGIEAQGEIRHQFHHVNDLAPTLLELLNQPQPEVVGGRRVQAMQGSSMAYSLDQADAPSRKAGQYYEIEGQRAYTAGDWKIVSFRAEDEAYDDHPWMLFKLADDPAETIDLAEKFPERVAELDARWWADANRYNVLPLIDMPLLQRAFRTRSRDDGPRRWVLERDITPILVGNAPSLAGRSYRIEARLPGHRADDEGVLLAMGDAHSGYSLYVQDNHLVYELNVGHTRTRVVSGHALPEGDVQVAWQFEKDNTALALASSLVSAGNIDPWKTLAGTGYLLVNGKHSGEARVTTPLTAVWEGLEVGQDSLSPVSPHYQAPFRYSGELPSVSIKLE